MNRRLKLHLLLFLFAGLLVPDEIPAQSLLSETNADTRIERISFRYSGSRTFDDSRLRSVIATRQPGTMERLKRRFDFLPFVHPSNVPFDPVELQRDVVRLKRFFRRNGFLNPFIDYPASQFDAEQNEIHVVFSMREGAPLAVDSFSVAGTETLPGEVLNRWERFLDHLRLFSSGRYTDFEKLRIEGEILAFLQDRGYAFARIDTDTAIDSTRNETDVTMRVDPGPRARVDSIIIEGNTSIDERIVRRELPFREGDYFSRSKLSLGQRELFGLNLFRLALADMPPQPVDSTVTVRYRVREAQPRFVSAQTGYSRTEGLSFDASARHRNFLGGARQLSVSASSRTGIAAQPGSGRNPVETINASVSIRQPYVVSTRLSSTLSPFYNRLDDPNQNTRFYEIGITTSFLLEILPFRNISFQHTLSRAVPLTASGLTGSFDIYDRSVLGLGITAGKLNDYLNPKRGFLIRSQIEGGGLLIPSGVTFIKGVIEARGYIPLTRQTNVVVSLTYGRMKPYGNSRRQSDPETEFRFDPIRFYSGGATDVRGWGLNALGPQVARADSILIGDEGVAETANAHFEAVGGLAKLGGSMEFRVPFPGMDDRWRLAAFLDVGALSSSVRRDENGRMLFDDKGEPTVRDSGNIRDATYQFGTGLGFRYRTPVGSIRLDLALKINPLDEDLLDPEDIVLYREGYLSRSPERKNGRRFNLHLSIDRTF